MVPSDTDRARYINSAIRIQANRYAKSMAFCWFVVKCCVPKCRELLSV